MVGLAQRRLSRSGGANMLGATVRRRWGVGDPAWPDPAVQPWKLTAWGVAGLLDDEDVLDLVVQGAAAMDEATTQPSGLEAIRGLKRATLDGICRIHGTYVAIVDGEEQILGGGTEGTRRRNP